MLGQGFQFTQRPDRGAFQSRLQGSSSPSDNAGDFSRAALSFDLLLYQPCYALVLLCY